MIRSNIHLNEENLLSRIESYNQGYLKNNNLGCLKLYGDIANNMEYIVNAIEDSHNRQAITLFAKNIKMESPLLVELSDEISKYVNNYFVKLPEIVTNILSQLPESNYITTCQRSCNLRQVSNFFNNTTSKLIEEWLKEQAELVPLAKCGLRSASETIEFVKQHKLTKIDLTDISFSEEELIALGENCPNMTAVTFPYGLSYQSIIAFVKKCPDLIEINYMENEIEGEVIKEIANNCLLLQKINLSKTGELSDQNIIDLVNGCPNLIEIDISNNSVTEEGLSEIAKHSHKLIKLKCNDNPITTDGLIEVIKNCPNLIEISFRNTYIDGNAIIEVLKDHRPNLTKLSATRSDVDSDGFQTIINTFSKLESLSIHDYPVTYKELVDLATACPNLVSYKLTIDDISDDEFDQFSKAFPHCKYTSNW